VKDYDYLLAPLLAQGKRPPEGALLPFDTVVLCAVEAQPRLDQPGLEVLRLSLKDHGPPPTDAEMQQAVDAGAAVARRLRQKKRVLVTCQMGLNRSGLVNALALMNLGYSAEHAIATVKKARSPFALSNTHFKKFLRLYGRELRRAS
jgi:protein-tyrosine phosphatase